MNSRTAVEDTSWINVIALASKVSIRNIWNYGRRSWLTAVKKKKKEKNLQ
jgi:hypothetical protein